MTSPKRHLITVADIRTATGPLNVPAGTIVTPAARELAADRGIEIITAASPVPEAPAESPAPVRSATLPPRDFAARLDHTNLSPAATVADIECLCREAATFGFASVCVNPVRVPDAARCLHGSGVAVCAVVGFPTGAHTTDLKAREAVFCRENGAREIDMVAASGWLLDGNLRAYAEDIRAVRNAVGDRTILKVIIEAPLLGTEDIVRAAVVAERSGADFVKTSTGVYAKASVEDVALLRRVLAPGTRIKAAGGIKTAGLALRLLAAGADRIGTSSSVPIMGELGAVK